MASCVSYQHPSPLQSPKRKLKVKGFCKGHKMLGKDLSSLTKDVQKTRETARIGWCPPWPRMQHGRYLKEKGLEVCWVGARLKLPKPLRPEFEKSQELWEDHVNPSLSEIQIFEPSHWQRVGSKG